MSSSRYIIGIDLGTSNCGLAYIDTLNADQGTQLLQISQQQTEQAVGSSRFLPSFLFLPQKRGDVTPSPVVGQFAKRQLSYLPGRVVSSAKSWLAHQDSLGTVQILPWGSDEINWQDKVSAVDASAAYLQHLAQNWNETIGSIEASYRFEQQRVIITVPASFTEAAQSLTLEAARKAGFPSDVRLLEEPQAALYYWLEHQADSADLSTALGQIFPDISDQPKHVLVCDVGGGTTDFSLFELRMKSAGVEIVRSKVSDHLLLGGDNIDFALAEHLEPQLRRNNKPLSTAEWIKLTAQCREAKETVFGSEQASTDTFHISIAGSGSSLFDSSRTASLPLSTLQSLVTSVFFPSCSAKEAAPRMLTDPSEIGLPTVAERAITRHLSTFLDGVEIDGILYAGGSLAPRFLRDRITEIVSSWMQGELVVLENPEISEAVARGAARFGHVLEHPKDVIHGGYPRSLYIEVEGRKHGKKLICIVAKGAALGTSIELDSQPLRALVNQPIRIQPYYSSSRSTDAVGDIIDFAETHEIHPLPMLQTVLELPPGRPRPPHDQLQVNLNATISETGLLNVTCHEAAQSSTAAHAWALTFNVRNQAEENPESTVEEESQFELPTGFEPACEEIEAVFGKAKQTTADIKPKRLVSSMERLLSQKRADWHPLLLRKFWPVLERGMARRNRSVAHESTWLYLAGFLLRPGYGTSVDSTYMLQLWRCFDSGLRNPKEAQVADQWNIMWRRVAGGLEQAKQEQLFHLTSPKIFNKGKSASLESIRLACSLERISIEAKEKMGSYLLKRICAKGAAAREHLMWELGRLSCRVPMYASTQHAVPPDILMNWFGKLQNVDWSKSELTRFQAIFSQACRVSGDRSVDLSLDQQAQVLQFMRGTGAPTDCINVIENFVESSDQDKRMLFGESLPLGLKLVKS